MASTMSLEKAQQDGFVIGLAGTGNAVARREIDDLVRNDPDCFNLFLLALRNIMKDGSKTGYFQIAGIHGVPLTDWDVSGYLSSGLEALTAPMLLSYSLPNTGPTSP